MTRLTRRSLLGAMLAAPAIVRASSLDGLHLLRPASRPIAASSIVEIRMLGDELEFVLSDGGVIGPVPLPQPMTFAEAKRYGIFPGLQA